MLTYYMNILYVHQGKTKWYVLHSKSNKENGGWIMALPGTW